MARTAQTFGNIKELKSRHRWRASYPNPLMPGGNPRVERTFKTKADATAWLAGEEVLVRDHWAHRRTWTPWRQRERERQASLQAGSVTLERYAESKLENFRKTDGSRPAESYLRKLREYHSHLSETPFWTKPLSSITSEEVTAWRNNTTLEPTPRLRAWQELKKLMRMAEEEGLIDKSPVIGRAPKVPVSKQAAIPEATAEEIKAIYEHMPEYDRIAVYLAGILDLRISEVLALQIGDIDLKHNIVHIRHGLGRGKGDRGPLRLKETKTASSTADMAIPDALRPLLIAQIGNRTKDRQLIESPRGGILADATLRRHFDRAKAEAGRPDLHFHVLRATAITAATRSGATLRDTMAYGRHSDAKTSIERYQRAGGMDRKREIGKSVAAQLLPDKRTREDVERDIRETKRQLARLEAELAAIPAD